MHAVVARSTFGSQHVQNISALKHFWKLRCRKISRSCGTKHIWKSTCTKHTMFGPLSEVDMSKQCTPLWREAHLEVNMSKTSSFESLLEVARSKKVHARYSAKHIWKSTYTKHTMFGPLLEVEMSKNCTQFLGRSTFSSQNVQNTLCSDHFWKLRSKKCT